MAVHAAQTGAVLVVVAGMIRQLAQILEPSLVLGGQTDPGLGQAGDGRRVECGEDGAQGAKVVQVVAVLPRVRLGFGKG